MNQTPNAQRPTLNVESLAGATPSNIKHQRSHIFWRILDFAVAGIFIYAGALKAIDPVQFASDIDNYKILPWPVSVVLSSLAGNFLCARACVSIFISRRAVDFECLDRGLHARHDCGKSSRTRYHLWLFRSRQPTLEFPDASHYQSRNSRRAACAWLFESVEKAFVGRALRLPVLIRQPRRLPYNSTRASFERAANIR